MRFRFVINIWFLDIIANRVEMEDVWKNEIFFGFVLLVN